MLKILLFGDSGVGKTAILNRFSKDEFNPSFITTIGIDFIVKTIEVGGKPVKIQIWDTAGQERFHTITSSFYRNANAVILVYDITNGQSFDNITKWLRRIDENSSEEVLKMLLGNKCDVPEHRAISRERGELLARDSGIGFLEVSAKSNVNIDTAFYILAEELVDRITNQPDTSGNTVNPITQSSSSMGGCC